jgi:hypothetical protein
MAARRAIDLALDLARTPALETVMRKQALPSDILDVIRIAAGCPESSTAALAATQKPIGLIRDAAILYLEEMLFFPEAGLHRNLGVASGASRAEMRLHMRWLLQWLHPDHNSDEMAALLAQRVIKAWRELGRRDGPEGSDESSARQQSTTRPPSSKGPRRRANMHVRWIAVPLPSKPRRRSRAVILVLAAAAAAALIFIPDACLFSWLSLFEPKVPAASVTTQHGAAATIVDGIRE